MLRAAESHILRTSSSSSPPSLGEGSLVLVSVGELCERWNMFVANFVRSRFARRIAAVTTDLIITAVIVIVVVIFVMMTPTTLIVCVGSYPHLGAVCWLCRLAGCLLHVVNLLFNCLAVFS